VTLTHYTRGTTGLYRVQTQAGGGFHNPERWTGTEWVSDDDWIDDLMEGRLDPNGEHPADIAARFPGAVRSG
jgi:hypothetical protein